MHRIGLLADSHGHAEITHRAAAALAARGADVLIHLGDLETTEVLSALAVSTDKQGKLSPPVRIVFGNVDIDREPLDRFARSIGITVDDPSGRLVIDGKIIIYQHGHSRAQMNKALAEGADYLCHGHSHEKRDEKVGRTRIINPGALYRADVYTVAILDVSRDQVEFLTIPGSI